MAYSLDRDGIFRERVHDALVPHAEFVETFEVPMQCLGNDILKVLFKTRAPCFM